LIQGLHSINAKFVNRIEETPGQRVWYNYWETCIKKESSYYARMLYVMMNPVKHGLVQNPENYPFSSYKYFIENSKPEFQKIILSCADDAQVEDNY
jgi:putative transposase